MNKFCSSCGEKNRSGARFCTKCGYKFTSSPSPLPSLSNLLDNRYRIIDVVKAGGMGCVYRAEDGRLGQTIALKKMLPVYDDDKEQTYMEERFREEARLLSSLHHGGLPKVSDFFTAPDPDTGKQAHFLVMTFIEGEDFDSIMKKRNRKPLPLDEVLTHTKQILEILDYLHSFDPPVIYRDLKPANVMIREGRIFLIDFGIARLFVPKRQGTMIGTPGYAAPEQYKGFAEPRSDIYSLGAFIHYLLSGIDPQDDSHAPFTFEPLSEINPDVPEKMEKLVSSMLELVSKNRPSSAGEIIRLIDGIDTVSPPPPPINAVNSINAATPPPPPPSVLQAPSAMHSMASKTYSVSQRGNADFRTIREALEKASNGDKIFVKPGLYHEDLHVTKSVEIIGDGPVIDVTVEGEFGSGIKVETDYCVIRGISIRCSPPGPNYRYYGLHVVRGRPLIEDCNISSESLACVCVQGKDANPVLRNCLIHSSAQTGIFFLEESRGMVENCRILRNAYSGVEIRESSEPQFTKCVVAENRQDGFFVYSGGAGVIEDCMIYDNTLSGVEVREGADPVFRRCRIYEGREDGVMVHTGGFGLFEECEISENQRAGIAVRNEGRPRIKGCKVYNQKQGGIFFYDDGFGIVEGTEVYRNNLAGVEIKTGADPTLKDCDVHDGRSAGVVVYETGLGTFENCRINKNAFAGVEIKTGGSPCIEKSKINDNGQTGFFVHKMGMGIIENCEINGNANTGIEIREEGAPTFRHCRINRGLREGIYVHLIGSGLFENCIIDSNGGNGVVSDSGGKVILRNCRISGSGKIGLLTGDGGEGRIENCEMRGNSGGSYLFGEQDKVLFINNQFD